MTYSDSTPSVAAVYDRRGRRVVASSVSDETSYSYNSAGQLLAETHTAGPLAGLSITNTYDSLLRRVSVGGTGILPVQFAYDAASRLSSVAQASLLATYSYLPNSSLVSNILFQTGTTNVMTTTKTYDALQRLTDIRTFNAQLSTLNAHRYTYNTANQRTRRTDADNSYWDYGYDSLGQVTSGHKKWADNAFVSGQQYGYSYDDIGNRQSAVRNSQSEIYSANSLNQYTQRTVPGYIWELGTAHSNATVTINNQPVARKGEYFAREIGVNNTSSAVYTQLTTVGVLKNAGSNQMDIVSTVTGKVFVAMSPELFAYDADGNLTSDGRWAYSWDAENRLIAVVAQASLPVAVPRQKVDFQYDHQSRRVAKQAYAWETDHWSRVADHRFVYDGWNLLAIFDSQSSILQSFVWGLDLSGTEQGAGGIGGLLMMNSTANGAHFFTYDGNGNVAALVSAQDASVSAQYEYSPFGETIRATGPVSHENPFRFSTKSTDDTTGLVLYEYRAYQPSTGRWVSRDPIEEAGGPNMLGFALNDPLNHVDPDGAKARKLPPIYTPPTPGKLAACLAKCGVMDIIGGAYEDKFEAIRLCGKIKNHCELEGALPKPEDIAGVVDLKPSGSSWGRIGKCFVDCLGLTGEFDVEAEGLYTGGGSIYCNKTVQRVEYSIPITLRLKLVPGDFILKEEKKSNKGWCGTVAYSRCCCGD